MVNVWFFDRTNARNFACQTPDLAHLDSTTIWRLESRQNPHAGKRALRSAAFPACGFAELSSSATGARSRRTLVGVSRCARPDFALRGTPPPIAREADHGLPTSQEGFKKK